ncbi:hypothetical protein Goklo_017033, partial [Gossypium klotzschianum]|nr:hypothetical protein [Gossypium klotzschianum]
MAIRLPRIVSSKKVPKGYFAVYVGENQKRFVIPVSFLNHPSFQDLLGMSQEEFGYSHPTGGLTIPCNEDTFLKVTSRMQHADERTNRHKAMSCIQNYVSDVIFTRIMACETPKQAWDKLKEEFQGTKRTRQQTSFEFEKRFRELEDEGGGNSQA